jgi:hypothetical protein
MSQISVRPFTALTAGETLFESPSSFTRMTHPKDDMDFPQSWRALAGAGVSRPTPAVVTPIARRRGFRNRVPFLFFLLLIGVAGVAVFFAWEELIGGPKVTVSRHAVSFKSDSGHLDLKWFLEYAGFNSPGKGGVSVDDIERKLSTAGQVQKLKRVRRHVSDNGVDVEVQERVPVFRYKEDAPEGHASAAGLRLVGTDGVIYEPQKYSKAFVETLPWLAHAAPVPPKDGSGLPVVPGIQELTKFVALARQNNPDFARQWEHLSVENFQEGRPEFHGAFIRVRLRREATFANGAYVRDLVFSADPARFEFEFSAYTTPKLHAWVRGWLGQSNPQKTPSFDLCFFFTDRSNTSGLPSTRQARLLPVL